jgi:acyl-CoA reductase-like NAD-dependent aldehyde dehydrogenase
VPETTALLGQHWDLIFFTGSPQVGKIIHQAAAKHLTPCVLELGGKSPTVVHSSADLKSAARRIAYGRFSNAGQICTAPDHVLVWPDVKDELIRWGFEAFTNARGVLYHSARIDPAVRYPPYSKHQRERAIESKLS